MLLWLVQGRSAGQSQSILPVTSAMIQAATPSADTFMLDDVEINQVCVCVSV